MKQKRDDRDKGGLLWIAIDCLRVGNIDKAHSILADIIRQEPKDYKPFCAMGFLLIDKNEFQEAKQCFRKALEYAKTSPQKTMIHFLIARIYYIENDLLRAKEVARKTIRFNPYCPEAHYLDIVLKFHNNEQDAALSQLCNLVKSNREYYLIALIDPELAHYCSEIQMKLETLFVEAREAATRILPESREELKRFESLMGENSEEVLKAQSMLSRIEELMNTDSFFGYLDVIHYGNLLITLSQKNIEERKKKLDENLWNLEQRLKKCTESSHELSFKSLSRPISQTLISFKKKLDKANDQSGLYDSKQYKKEFEILESLSSELTIIELKLSRLNSLSQIMLFSSRFLKKTMVFQAANLILALVLFPMLIYYLNIIIPNLEIAPKNIWYYQKAFIILGGISGLVLASVFTRTDGT